MSSVLAWWRSQRPQTQSRLLLAAGLALALAAVAIGALVAAQIVHDPPVPSFPAIVVSPSPMIAEAPSASPSPEPTRPARMATPTTHVSGLTADSIAVVTGAGDGLRVRSAPGVGPNSRKLEPLLPAGSRMLVVRGPIAADGYDWYETLSQQDDASLFGWVADGRDAEDWIEPGEPQCTDDLDEAALWAVRPIDFLLCYGDRPVNVRVRSVEPDTGSNYGYEPACPYTGDDVPCSARPAWLYQSQFFLYASPDAPEGGIAVAARGSVDKRLAEAYELDALTLTVSMDATQAGGCRIVDRKGRNLISRDEAITRCRLTWVVRDVTWDAADVLPVTDTLARALTRLPLRDSPDGAVLTPSLAVGTEVVVVGQTGVEDGVRWYAVTPADQAARAFGWVPFRGSNGTPTLRVVHPDCPSPRNWAAVSRLSPGRRFVCFGSHQFTVNLEVVRRDQPPDGGVCEFTGPVIGCVAGPAWLTDMSGVAGIDPLHAGRGIDLRIDPTRVERDAFPTTPTLMGVTGSFGSEEAYECTVHDSETGRELLADVQAIAHCNQQFVVTALGSPAP